jgi:guanosine-3',5'-bis(diphosphate) 3'-pyrophosphohydrolase
MSESLNRARAFAVAAHGDQMYGDQPYSFHLDMVAEILAAFVNRPRLPATSAM